MGSDIVSLTAELRELSIAREWSKFHSPKNLASALCVKSGELLENFQWLTEEQSRQPTEQQKRAIASEVADVLLYLLQLCDALSFDPIQVAREKLALIEEKYPVERARRKTTKYTDL